MKRKKTAQKDQRSRSSKRSPRAKASTSLPDRGRHGSPQNSPAYAAELLRLSSHRFDLDPPSTTDVVTFLGEYNEIVPLREFIALWAVRWLRADGITVEKRASRPDKSRPTPKPLTVGDVSHLLSHTCDLLTMEFLNGLAFAWIEYEGTFCVDPKQEETLWLKSTPWVISELKRRIAALEGHPDPDPSSPSESQVPATHLLDDPFEIRPSACKPPASSRSVSVK